MNQQQQAEWFEAAWIGDSDFPLASLSIDPVHDLLWTASQDGRVSSYMMPAMERYSAFRAHQDSTLSIVSDQFGICSLSRSTFRYHSKGGLVQSALNLEEEFGAMECIALNQRSHGSRAIIGGDAFLLEVDLMSSNICGNLSLSSTGNNDPIVVIHPNQTRSSLFCGTTSGSILCVDPRSMQIISKIETHPSGVVCIDSHADLLATCGFSKRMGQINIDPYLKIFDIRTNRLLRSIFITSGPAQLKFYPQLSSTLVVASRNGSFKMVDSLSTVCGPDLSPPFECGAMLTCMELAPSGEAIFLGDSNGHAHILTFTEEFTTNQYSVPLTLPENRLPSSSFGINEEIPLSTVPFPEDGDQLPLASTWNSASFPIPPPAKSFDQILLPQVLRFGIGSFIDLSKLSKSQLKSLAISEPRLAARLARIKKGETLGRPDKIYRHIDLKKKKMQNDLTYLNQTNFAGLENNLPNSFANSLLQILYFIPHIRANVLNHLCNRDYCLACELSFLFKMLDQSKQSGTSFSARNFFRSLRQIPQALALGIVENRSVVGVSTASGTDLPTLLATFCRFLLEQTNKELSNATTETKSIVDTLMGLTSQTSLACTNCSHSWQRTAKSLMIDLVDARSCIPNPAANFMEMAEASLCRVIQSKAWCDRCSHYQQTEQHKFPETLPPILCFCANPTEGSWPGLESSLVEQPSTAAAATKFYSPWLPLRIRIINDPIKKIVSIKEESISDPIKTLTNLEEVYELTGLIAHVVDPHPKTPACGNLVALVKVSSEYLSSHVQGGSEEEEGSWFLINDFRVSSISRNEVVKFPSWKRPCLSFYTSVTLPKRIPLPEILSPIDGTQFHSRFILNHVHGIAPLVIPTPGLIPKRGELVAIDAEYVSLSAEGIVTELDGTQIAITPSHLSVARVSCIYGQGPLLGEPLIDDYVHTSEPVVDYLTRFSGISPGDLDPLVSNKRLTTLKNVYLKLRYLLDNGCVFVGHGLRNDFKVIGLHLPQEQSIDTVELFHTERQRYISLRFLAAMLLHIDIQSTVHDSMEDARTALALYDVYLQLQKNNQLQNTIQELYRVGYLTNWQIPSLQK